MDFGFREPQHTYKSGSQRAKAWSEQWAADNLFCPNCGHSTIAQLPANSPVADFWCFKCHDQYELKSQKKPFGAKLANGAYSAKCERLVSSSNPNLVLLNYDEQRLQVRNVSVIPKHFFVLDIVEKRKPLSETARRAGWIGSNILLAQIPAVGRIDIVRDGVELNRVAILAEWQRTLFLRAQEPSARGWLIDVMKCIESLNRREFGIEDVYAFENLLSRIYPQNNNVRPKIRQQLQVLRDNRYLEFTSRGRYRLA